MTRLGECYDAIAGYGQRDKVLAPQRMCWLCGFFRECSAPLQEVSPLVDSRAKGSVELDVPEELPIEEAYPTGCLYEGLVGVGRNNPAGV